jgi:competence protein ComEA
MKNQLRMLCLAVVSLVFVFSMVAVQAADQKININTADIELLTTLDRIGPSYAARIIEYREKTGKFTVPADIMKVKGIGQKTYEANMDSIVVTDEVTAKTE